MDSTDTTLTVNDDVRRKLIEASVDERELTQPAQTRADGKRNLRAAIEKVAARLGNTPTICQKCYVHPEVLTSYLDGNLVLEIKTAVEKELRDDLGALQPEEAAVLAMLRGRLCRELSGGAARPRSKRCPTVKAA